MLQYLSIFSSVVWAFHQLIQKLTKIQFLRWNILQILYKLLPYFLSAIIQLLHTTDCILESWLNEIQEGDENSKASDILRV